MTTVSSAHKARGARLTELATTTITRVIKVRSTSRHGRKYRVALAELREELDDVRVGSVTSRPLKFACGFVDFLLGRSARYRR